MKYLKNHFYVLVSHVFICSFVLIYYFSVIGLVSVVLSTLFLITVKFTKKFKNLQSLIQLILFSLIPFSYSTDSLIHKFDINWASFILAVVSVIIFAYAMILPRASRDSRVNVKTKFTEDKEIRIKSNEFATKSLYLILLPVFLLIFYIHWAPKLILCTVLILGVIAATTKYSYSIGYKKLRKVQEEYKQQMN